MSDNQIRRVASAGSAMSDNQIRRVASAASAMSDTEVRRVDSAAGVRSIKRLRSWKERVFGIGPEDLGLGQVESSLISPLSPFSLCWTLITALLLAYTAVVTPPQISFGWLDPPCSPSPTV